MNAKLRSFEIPGVATFEEGPGGLPFLAIATPAAEARIFLHGAHLTHWKPAGAEPVIFLSADSLYQEGKAIRGGVPVCFPWFGPRDGLPAHGFVRNRTWDIESVQALEDGSVQAVFVTRSNEETRAKWPHEYVARLKFIVGATLTMELEAENISLGVYTISEALHTYFVVGDARQAAVEGLDGTEYRDFPDRTQISKQSGPIRFEGEVDRVYVNTRAACVLDDPILRRRIVVEKDGSNSTTVWNPWAEKAAALTDFGDHEWQRMVCIETVNAFENSVELQPGARHRMTTRISVLPR